MLFVSEAKASAGAYTLLLAEAEEAGAKRLQAQLKAFPDVAKVDLVDTSERTPSAAELRNYDAVVSIGDSNYLDNEAWGESLASYVDSGGIVVQSAYDTWDDSKAVPGGRFASGGYAPFLPGVNVNKGTTLATVSASSPLMRGITSGSLSTTVYNTKNELAPGAALLAYWADGRPAIAVKGRVLAVSSYIGDGYDSPSELAWTGNYGQLVVNAARTFTPQPLTVLKSNPAGGWVLSTVGDILCGSVCTAGFSYGTAVSLGASPNKGFAFTGFTGACTGVTCALTMEGPRTVTANFAAFGFGKKVKRKKKKGTARIAVNVEAPGTLVLHGRDVKRRTRAVAAGKVELTIAAKGKARKKLRRSGKARVSFLLRYTPIGGTPAWPLEKAVVLKRTP